jgi:hypothetical protein
VRKNSALPIIKQKGVIFMTTILLSAWGKLFLGKIHVDYLKNNGINLTNTPIKSSWTCSEMQKEIGVYTEWAKNNRDNPILIQCVQSCHKTFHEALHNYLYNPQESLFVLGVPHPDFVPNDKVIHKLVIYDETKYTVEISSIGTWGEHAELIPIPTNQITAECIRSFVKHDDEKGLIQYLKERGVNIA